MENAWLICKNLYQLYTYIFISTIYKSFGYNFWWNCLEFSDKMTLIIPKKMFNSVKHRDVIYLKFGDSFFISLTKLRLE